MATFPKAEADVAALAEAMITGLTANPLVYPAPPVAVLDLTAAKTAYTTAINAVIAAKAAAQAATEAKDTALDTLTDAMKTDIRYAENTVNFDDVQLQLIGWAGKKTPTPLTAPGQTRELTIPVQGDGSLSLAWKAPVDGGHTSRIQGNEKAATGRRVGRCRNRRCYRGIADRPAKDSGTGIPNRRR